MPHDIAFAITTVPRDARVDAASFLPSIGKTGAADGQNVPVPRMAPLRT
ncbi:hypothetical protein QMO14_29960 [Variovorax sp. CAN2819]|nr:hypothetical protein [Variovorax sp. CAN15]MDN6887808.1 hypothetical protein [Variovorax sp. CAN15]